MNRTATAERLDYRFLDDLERQGSARARDTQPLSVPSESAPDRFDVVEGGRRTQVAQAVQGAAFGRAQTASWSPLPAAGRNAAVEQYRRLAATLIHAQAERGVRIVMVTSSVGSEGKSLTTANLAVTLARSYHRNTLIIDADRRAPSQHEIFRVANSRGLTDHLRGDEGPAPVVSLQDGLTLLPAGRPTNDPVGGLASARMKRVITDASAAFDFTLIDTPPAALVPDASLLSAMADAVILVVAAGSTPFEIIQRTVAVLGKERILGTVLNRAEQTSSGRYGYGYYGYPSR
jgi:capsular exopolysaccharide synthesis family protein